MTDVQRQDRFQASGKTRTFIKGLDQILGGGVPAARTTLVVGGPGSGKTVLASEFLARGALNGQPGVFVTFEQGPGELLQDLRSFNWGFESLVDDGLVKLHRIDLESLPSATTGTFNLDGLLMQIASAIEEVGASRIALDTLEALQEALGNSRPLRSELRRLFRWLDGQGITSLVTSESGTDVRTPYQLEEYVADCVITLDYRLDDGLATRRARVLKCRGGAHSGDEHPFMISGDGFRLIPVTESRLEHPVRTERVSTGLPGLDRMLGGQGYFEASSVLVSGTPGAGKSTLAAAFANAACARGERALYLAFEESPEQVIRNMGPLGFDLGRWADENLLRLHARRPSQRGLEEHLVVLERLVEEFEPRVVVIDPFTSLSHQGQQPIARSMMLRVVDLLKERGITALYTSLLPTRPESYIGDSGLVSSLMDTWVVLRARYAQGQRRRFCFIRKSRGMDHSIRLSELVVDAGGLRLVEVEGTQVPDGWAE